MSRLLSQGRATQNIFGHNAETINTGNAMMLKKQRCEYIK